jgi:hypothetical protein
MWSAVLGKGRAVEKIEKVSVSSMICNVLSLSLGQILGYVVGESPVLTLNWLLESRRGTAGWNGKDGRNRLPPNTL